MADETIRFEAEVVMTLFCESCGRTHKFKSPDVERVIYSLQAQVSDLRDELSRRNPDYFGPEGTPCLQGVLYASNDAEGYQEHVEAMIEARGRLQ